MGQVVKEIIIIYTAIVSVIVVLLWELIGWVFSG